MNAHIETRLAAMRERAGEATEGPWLAEYSGEQGNCVIPHDAESTREAVAVTRLFYQQADAEFIAAARTDLPILIDALWAVLRAHEEFDPGEGRPPFCYQCSKGLPRAVRYPCPTVQAVEATFDHADEARHA